MKEGCNQEEVKSAFLRLAKQYHPDANLGNSDASHFHKVILGMCGLYKITTVC